MGTQVADNQKLPIKYGAVDAEGNPTTPPAGTPSFTVSPTNLGTVETDTTDTSGLSIFFRPSDTAGNLGDGQVQGSFAPSDGSAALPMAPVDVSVIAAGAANFGATVGTPISK